MSLLLSVDKIEKQMGSKQLFESLSFVIHEKEKLGLIGPNGSGKSTLLKILSGDESTDSGTVSPKKGLKLSFVKQEESFDESLSLIDCSIANLQKGGMSADDAMVYGSMYLSLVGFSDLEQKVKRLSGGWRKRLSLAIALATEPELLILDEPTNHMDWEGILWLEGYLKTFTGSFVLVSHDRAFLNRVCTKTMELNHLFRDGFLAFQGSYNEFLDRKAEYIDQQLKLQSTMSNKARREVEWLRAGVKARTTKSQSRIKEAHQLLDDLADVKARNRANQAKVKLEIESTNRLSKKLVELNSLNISYNDNVLVRDLNLLL
ncbi:MAG: ATP-binding cassette domain-containing protein, partial [Pseudomonadota bacterium]